VRKVTKKIEDQKVKASLLEDSAMHPTIDDGSRKIVEGKLAEIRYSKPIHERLYELNKEILDKKEMQRHMELEKFRAQASQILEGGGSAKKRDNLEQILYDDADKRRKEQQRAKEHLDKVRDLPQSKPYHNEKSEKFVRKRFERDLRLVQEEVVLGKHLSRANEVEEQEAANTVVPDKNLNIQEMVQVLTKMGFIPNDRAPNEQET
jgi:hypothetical protein